MEISSEIMEKARNIVDKKEFYEKGEPLNDEQTLFLEAVPEWAKSWEWIESNDDATLIDAYMKFYGMSRIAEIPTSLETLLAKTYAIKYIISDGENTQEI